MAVYTSPAKAFSLVVRDAQYLPPDPSGYREQIKSVLEVNFRDDTTGGSFIDSENATTRHDIRGGAFDTDEAAARLGWDEEEKRLVEYHLDRISSDPMNPNFRYVNKYIPEAPADPFGGGYESLSPTRVLAIASELGKVQEALDYEQATENRPELVVMLQKKLGMLREEESLIAS